MRNSTLHSILHAFASEAAERLGVIEGKIAVAIGDEERRLEDVEGLADGSGRSEQVRPLVRVANAQPVAGDNLGSRRANIRAVLAGHEGFLVLLHALRDQVRAMH